MVDAENEAEFQRRAYAVACLAELFRQNLSEHAIGLFVGATSDVPSEAFDVALGRAAKESRFMPTPSEIREFGFGATEDDAAAVWPIVERVASGGMSRSPDFGDPTIHAAIRALGGWVRFCEQVSAEPAFARRDFAKHLRRVRLNGVTGDDGRRLIGTSEITNRGSGFKVQSVVRIDREGRMHAIEDPDAERYLEGAER